MIAVCQSVLLFLSAAALAMPSLVHAGSMVPPGYTLTWADEFDGQKLDTERWLYRTTRRGTTSICLPENVSVKAGKLHIDLKRERRDGASLTCGGVITRQRHKYGYFEVRCKLDGGKGWHEAFWTTATTNFKLTNEQRAIPRIEIDAFEHYALHDGHKFTYGIIEWYPTKGSVCREVVESPVDLSDDFHVYGFEFTPDYIAFYLDGKLLSSVDVRFVPHNRHHLWLSCIGTQVSEDMRDGVCQFDYFRAYEIDFQSKAYENRRWEFVQNYAKPALPAVPKSAGLDLWIEAEHFHRTGGWAVERDGQGKVLIGHRQVNKDRPWDQLAAQTQVELPQAGEYRLWVRARDYAENMPGRRRFQVAVNGVKSKPAFGTHKQEGYTWQDGGVFKLEGGLATLELIDTSQFFARCDKLLLTTDLEYQPPGLGGPENVKHLWQESELRSAR